MPPRETQPTNRLKSDKVAYWYFRLNGFLQIENFVVHPSGRASQRTDADLLAVRFPYRREFLFDHPPMRDDDQTLSLSPDCIDIVIAEIKRNQPCCLNGPWTNQDAQNIHRVLAAIGCFREVEIQGAALAIYENGAFRNNHLRVRLAAVGRNINATLADQYHEIIQLTWQQMLCFIWHRFDTYRNQKRDVEQWDGTGKQLRCMATAEREPGPFVKKALQAMSISDGE
jgi:hypothetical protein